MNNHESKIAQQVEQHLIGLADPSRAQITQRFFKTSKGSYSESEQFLGIRVPELRKQVAQYAEIPLPAVEYLLESPFHEIRHFAVLSLVFQFEHALEFSPGQACIAEFYVQHSKSVNNWDLVDCSAHKILGCFEYQYSMQGCLGKHGSQLKSLANSENLWQRRISMVACWYFINKQSFDMPLRIAKMLLADSEDLIQKAVGWMLRELGKQEQQVLESFLIEHYASIARTTLRYAIERFPNELRVAFLKGEF